MLPVSAFRCCSQFAFSPFVVGIGGLLFFVQSCSRALAGTNRALLSVLFLPLLSVAPLVGAGLSFVFWSSFLSIYFSLVPTYCCPIGRIRGLTISSSIYYLLLLPIAVALLLLNGSLSTLLLADKSQGAPGGLVEKAAQLITTMGFTHGGKQVNRVNVKCRSTSGRVRYINQWSALTRNVQIELEQNLSPAALHEVLLGARGCNDSCGRSHVHSAIAAELSCLPILPGANSIKF